MSLDGSKDEVCDCISLLISILVSFPEVDTIKYLKDLDRIKLTFIINNSYAQYEMENELAAIKDSIMSYHILGDDGDIYYAVDTLEYAGYYIISLYRDMATMTKAEFSFIVELFRQFFDDSIVIDSDDYDDIKMDGVNNAVLVSETGDDISSVKDFLAYRSSGKVMIMGQ